MHKCIFPPKASSFALRGNNLYKVKCMVVLQLISPLTPTNPMDPNVPQCTPMDPNGFKGPRRTLADLIGPQRTPMDSNGHKRTQTDTNGPKRTQTDPCGPYWTQTDPNGLQWTQTDLDRHKWTQTDPDGTPSQIITLHTLLILYVVHIFFFKKHALLFFPKSDKVYDYREVGT